MRRIITPVQDGGIPIDNDDLVSMQNLALVPLQETLKGLDKPMVLSGCEVSNINTTNSTLTIAPGYVYVGGTVMSFPGYSGVYPVRVKAGTPVVEQRVFEDGFTKPAFETPVATTTTANTADTILFDPQTVQTFAELLRDKAQNVIQLDASTDVHTLRRSGDFATHNTVNGPTNNWCYYSVKFFDTNPNNLYGKIIAYDFFTGQVWTKTCASGGWSAWSKLASTAELSQEATNRETQDNNLNARIDTLVSWHNDQQNSINWLNANKASNAEEDWAGVTIPNTDFGTICRVRRDNAGWVHIKGLYLIRSTGDGATSNGMQLPAGFRPAQDEYFTVTGRVTINNATGSWFHTFITFKIQPDGHVYFDNYEYDRANGLTTSTPPANYVLSYSGPGNYKGQ